MRPPVPPPARRRRAVVLSGPRKRRNGFTLIEIIIVLVLLGMAAALVLPALLFPHSHETASLTDLVRQGREAAAARGEALLLRVDAAGRWELRPASDSAPPLAHGMVADTSRTPFTLRLTPTGLCAPVPSGTERVAVDPLDCATLP